jgi:hypothetical protein
VYDLPGAAAEDTGPWQDTWAAPAAPVGHEADSVESSAGADEAEPSGDIGPEPVGDVQEWLEAGAVESYGWDLGEETPPGPAGEEVAAASVNAEGAEPWAEPLGLDALAEPLREEPAPDDWIDAEDGAETGDVIEMVEEPGPGPAMEFAPAEPPVDEEVADERVAIVPPTPLDSWYHGEHGAEAEATWEAFGRALEEAASWGDLDTTIATGLAPEEARGEVKRAPAAELPAAQPVPEPEPDARAADAAVTDLARRLEHLAQRLRAEGEKGVEHAMTEGDRLEASLAGFIAGYVAARRG